MTIAHVAYEDYTPPKGYFVGYSSPKAKVGHLVWQKGTLVRALCGQKIHRFPGGGVAVSAGFQWWSGHRTCASCLKFLQT